MQGTLHSVQAQAAAKEHDTAIFVALELSKASWLIAINAPGSDKVSRYVVAPADTAALMVILTLVKRHVVLRVNATRSFTSPLRKDDDSIPLFDRVLSRMMWKFGLATSPGMRLSGQAARSMH